MSENLVILVPRIVVFLMMVTELFLPIYILEIAMRLIVENMQKVELKKYQK